jgi:hypothetical protein
MQFTATNSLQIELDISCYRLISEAYDTKFLGICVAGSTLDLKIHTEEITHNLNAVCYVERSVESITLHEH